MHIKKFEAADLKAALAHIRAELGPDAVILETARPPQGGVTVLAALPRDDHAYAGAEPRPAAIAARPEAPVAAAQAGSPFAALSRMAAAAPDRTAAPARRPMPSRLETAGEAAGTSGDEALRERLVHLGRLVRSDHFSAVPLPLRQLYFDLTDAEVDADLVFQILQRIGRAPLPGQFTPAPPGDVLRVLRGLVSTGGAVASGMPRRVLVLAGPTGVGKTTTAAKIAGHAAFRLGCEVALVSTDAYRIFGAQHLASYAALMGLPFEAVSSASEMRLALETRFRRADLVLVDTSGRSPRDPEGIREIHELLAACPDCDVHLVLAANGRARDLALALDAFSVLPVRHLLFTKLDEATSRGGVFTTALKARRPVSYLGTGQEVPDDLEAATTEALTAGLVTGGDDVRPGR